MKGGQSISLLYLFVVVIYISGAGERVGQSLGFLHLVIVVVFGLPGFAMDSEEFRGRAGIIPP